MRTLLALAVFAAGCLTQPYSTDGGPVASDFTTQPPHDLANQDQFASPDFGPSDFGFPVFDLAQGPFDFGFPVFDLAQGPPDLAQGPADMGHGVFDFAFSPDFAAIDQQCRMCLDKACGNKTTACESDPNCITTLNCAVQQSCLSKDPTSPGFASCIDTCMSNEGLTFQQQSAVFQELSALDSCYAPCQSACGG